MKQYLQSLRDVLDHGEDKTDRTGTGTISLFGHQSRYNLQDGFPAVTTKKLAWKSVVSELLWFLEGSTDERRLAEILHGTRDISKKTIWTANADNQGVSLGYTNTDDVKELGPVYGKQWVDFGGVNQIEWAINEINNNPDSRRIIVSAWNPPLIEEMALPPCHTMFQFYVMNGKLSCQMYQRSADMFLGVPFNIASYSLLIHIIANICDLEVGTFVHTIGDAHIYQNHVTPVYQQLTRSPMNLPTLNISKKFTSLSDVIESSVEDYQLLDYNPMPSIKAPMAV
jgi:thymidylate synthase